MKSNRKRQKNKNNGKKKHVVKTKMTTNGYFGLFQARLSCSHFLLSFLLKLGGSILVCQGENKTLKPHQLSFPFSSPIKHIKILLSFHFSLPFSIPPKIIPIKWPLKNFKYSLLWSKNSAIELHYSPQLKYKIQAKI